ncbi:MAG: lysine--tRNA ligase [Bacilli bacterium]|nr:lysine--tRNA ligase [Bacilli bacterium]
MEEKKVETSLTDQEKVRREKLPKYHELGVDPFGHRFVRTHLISEARSLAQGKDNAALEQANIIVTLAGRINALRRMGKASFMNIQDKTGKIQAYVGIDIIGEKPYALFKLADIGDIVGIKGRLMLTRTGELTVRVTEYTHLTKSLKPFPEKYHGLTDVEERYRHRYVDLIVNEKAKQNAIMRPKIIRAIQKYCDDLGFIEVETSVLSPILGGANARPFVTHHNTLDKDFYLRIATELPLKKLLVGGLERVYEIGRLFRNEGMDTTHNPEFTTIELYQAYGDLSDMRAFAEGLFRTVAKNVTGSTLLKYDDKEIDVGKPFKWVSMAELIKEATGVDFTKDIKFDEAVKLAKEHKVEYDAKLVTSTGQIMNAFFEQFCEAKLIQPTFVHTYPIEVSPLTKKSPDPRFVERFELYIDGHEMANAYTELNDPIDQKERFVEQLKAKERGDEEANEMDHDFLEALEYGMPPAGGIGIGIDRLVMLMCNEKSIREVILFPTMKDRK